MRNYLIKAAVMIAVVCAASTGTVRAEEGMAEKAAEKAKGMADKASGMAKGMAKGFFDYFPTTPVDKNWRPNTVMPPINKNMKSMASRAAMMLNPLSLREMINIMVDKRKVQEGVSFDEVIDAMKSKATDLNLRQVSHSTPYKVLRSMHDPKSPRLEIMSFCDLVTMREIVDYSPEFVAFLPCRIAVLEDADKQIWIITLDWDVSWLDSSRNQNSISNELKKRALKVRNQLSKVMEAGAAGDF